MSLRAEKVFRICLNTFFVCVCKYEDARSEFRYMIRNKRVEDRKTFDTFWGRGYNIDVREKHFKVVE